MNDLHLNVDHCKCILFVDDTTIYITHNDLWYMEWCAQTDLNKLGGWFMANKLTLNANKSNCILFHTKENKTVPISLMVNNVRLPLVQNLKFLGVWVDRNLDWCEHVNKVILKLKRNLNLLKVPKNLLLPHVKKSIYYAHFYSHLKYGIYIWGHMTSKAQLSKLQKIQHECTKLITSTNNIGSCTYKKLLQVKQIICLETSKLMFKSLNGELPKMLTEAITTDQNCQSLNKCHTYPTHNKHVPKIPCCSVKFYRDSFLCHCIKDYSSLTKQTRDAKTTEQFNRLCKLELLG